jgi:hypothetical protein
VGIVRGNNRDCVSWFRRMKLDGMSRYQERQERGLSVIVTSLLGDHGEMLLVPF